MKDKFGCYIHNVLFDNYDEWVAHVEVHRKRAEKEHATRNSALIDEFAEYCRTHPQERFWQALRNWSEHNFILIADELEGKTTDTFYMEGK